MNAFAELLESELNEVLVKQNKDAIKRISYLFSAKLEDVEQLKSEIKQLELRESENKNDVKSMLETMKHGFELMNKRFEAVDKRFEAVDKRFEAVDKRFEAVDKRFEDMQKYMDKRFEDMNKRFDMMFKFMGLGFSILSILIVIFKFMK